MANPLIKKRGYGYGYGYGYAESVSLLPSGRRNLLIAALILAVGAIGLGYRFWIWQENRLLTSAKIAWEMHQPLVAMEQLSKVRKWAVDSSDYDKTYVTLLLETDPSEAYEYLNSLQLDEDKLTPFSRSFFDKAKVLAASRAQNWIALKTELSQLKSKGDSTLQSPDYLVSLAQLNFQSQDLENGLLNLDAALQTNPFNEEAILLKSEILSFSNDPLQRNNALVSLRNLSTKGGANAFKARLILITGNFLPPSSSEWELTTSALERDPYLDFHYLTKRQQALDALLGALAESAPHLSYQILLKQLESAAPTPQLLTRAIYFAQESSEQEEAAALLALDGKDLLELDDFQWLQARQFLLSGSYEKALRTCQEVQANSGDKRTLAILAKLAGDTKISPLPTIRQQAAALLSQNPELSAAQWIFAANISWELDPDSRAKLLQSAQLYAKKTPLPIAQFLLSRGEAEQCIQALETAPPANENRYSAQLRFQALISARQLDTAKQFLLSLEAATETTRQMGLLQIALLKSSQQESTAIWPKAWAAADKRGNARAFAALADLAFEYKQWEWTKQAYERAQSLDPHLNIKADSLARFAELEKREGNTDRAKQLIAKARQLSDEKSALDSDWAYLSILTNESLLSAKDVLIDSRASEAAKPKWIIAMSLAQLRTGQAKDSLNTFRPLAAAPIDTLDNSSLAVYYAVSLANGQETKARTILDHIERDKLLPEEIALLEEYAPVTTEEIVLPHQDDEARLYQPTQS